MKYISIVFLILSSSSIYQQALAQKYDWSKGIGGIAADQVASLSLDASGNVYVAGSFQGTADFDPGPAVITLTSSGTNNIFIAKYDNNGNYLWAKKIGGTINDVAYTIRVAASGNFYISGYFSSPTVDFDPGSGIANLSSTASSYDMFIAKYDNNGNYLWAKKIGGIGADNAWSLQLDNSENVYVSGYFWATVDFDPGPGVANLTSAGNYDTFIGKYDNNGNYIWAKRMGSTGDDKVYAIDLDGVGNISITGAFQGTVDFDPGPGVSNKTAAGNYDIFIAHYDNAGAYIWANSIGGSGDDKPTRIAVDALGDIYVTGYFQSTIDFDPGTGIANTISNGGYDMFLAKYNVSGNYSWAKGIGSIGDDQSYGICFDDSSNVYMTGRFFGSVDFNPGFSPVYHASSGNSDVFIAKYTSTGNFRSVINMGGSGGDIGLPIFVDDQFDIYIGGAYSSVADFDPDPLQNANLISAGATDAFIAKYLQCFPADKPVITAFDDTLCAGDADTLIVLSGNLNKATHWQWYIDSCGGNPVDTGASIVVFPNKDITYYVRGEGGCPEPGLCTSISIKVNPLPTIDAFTKERICIGNPIKLFANSNDSIRSWQWYGPGGFLSYSKDTIIANTTLSNSGSYIVFGRDTNGCISQPVTINAYVQPLPLVNILNQDTVIIYGSEIQLHAQGADLYSWSPVKSLSNPFLRDPFASPKEATLYFVHGIDSVGCSNTDSVFVDIIFEDHIFIPSAFSPNNDGRNDIFKVGNISFGRLQEFRIFNRWGNEIFETTNINNGWDGTFKGALQESGTYFYIIRIGKPDGTSKTFKGNITLLR